MVASSTRSMGVCPIRTNFRLSMSLIELATGKSLEPLHHKDPVIFQSETAPDLRRPLYDSYGSG